LKLSGKEITDDLGDRKHERTTLAQAGTNRMVKNEEKASLER
jgi:hypothetical protein